MLQEDAAGVAEVFVRAIRRRPDAPSIAKPIAPAGPAEAPSEAG